MTDDLTPQGAAAVRLAATVVQLKAERDRARGIAVALEQQVARAERLADEWQETYERWRAVSDGPRISIFRAHANRLRAALDADQ